MRAHATIRLQIERALAPYDLSAAAYGVLSELNVAALGLSLTELADRVGLSRPRVSRLVDEMILDGLVTRTTDPNDNRARLVDTSESGKQRLREASVAYRNVLHHAIDAKLSQEETKRLAMSLERLAQG